MRRSQRIIQALSLTAFLVLLAAAGFPLPGHLPLDGFLRMDPVAGLVAAVSARRVIAAFWPALLIAAVSVLLGRFFCGHLCPMGTTIDLVDGSLGRGRPPAAAADGGRRWRGFKYDFLVFLIGAAAIGVSFVFVASPLALITRFYGNLVFPVFAAAADGLLRAAAALPAPLRPDALLALDVPVHRFAHPWFLVLFFAGVFLASRLAPRFWCRCLCPAGAMLALCSRRPVFRRRVSDGCIDCGRCQRGCPMGAIDAVDPRLTAHGECIVCRHCADVCPVDAVSFSRSGPYGAAAPVNRARRRLLGAGAAGAAAAVVTLTGLHHVHGREGAGRLLPDGLIRPPGSLPEDDFLARCLRCGACMTACPTNTLQPLGLAVGVSGLFSPVLTPRRGPCEPGCNVCGWVCPTGAIRSLPLAEKTWAKMGTAQIRRQACLAWEFNRRCLVCDEVCPYDAVELRREPGLDVGVPVVHEARCAGCGLCEHHCPVKGRSAIVVSPMGELRLAAGSYPAAGRSQGLSLHLTPQRAGPAAPASSEGPVPGAPFTGGPSGTAAGAEPPPPGFTR